MSLFSGARDAVENIGATAAAPFTFGQAERFVSRSGQDSGLGHFAQFYSDMARDADITGLIAGGAYLAAAPAIAGASEAAGPGAMTALAADAPAASTAGALSSGLVDPATGFAANYGTTAAAAAPATSPVTALAGKGLIERNPITSLIAANVAGNALGAVGQRQAQKDAQKHAEEMALLPQRQKQGNPSVGGAGVSLNVKPSGKLLKRPDGSTVFVPNTGIINTAMNGVRG